MVTMPLSMTNGSVGAEGSSHPQQSGGKGLESGDPRVVMVSRAPRSARSASGLVELRSMWAAVALASPVDGGQLPARGKLSGTGPLGEG